jgi:hypothetical protein
VGSPTKETWAKRQWQRARKGRKRKNRESKRSTRTWEELFAPVDEPRKGP